MNRTPDEIRRRHRGQEFWTSWDPERREPVDLDTYPVLNDNDPPTENLVYTTRGVRVIRRTGQPVDGDEYCGMLFNLSTLPALFDPSINSAEPVNPAAAEAPSQFYTTAGLDLYPQAFLGHVGHYQSSEHPTFFRAAIRKINSEVGDDELIDDPDLGPVIGGSCQGYNSILHRIRWRVHTHDVQLAQQTQFAGRMFASNSGEKAKGDKVSETLQIRKRPFSRLEYKLNTPNLNKSLRLENVYHIDIAAISDEYRNSRLVSSP